MMAKCIIISVGISMKYKYMWFKQQLRPQTIKDIQFHIKMWRLKLYGLEFAMTFMFKNDVLMKGRVCEK